MADAGIFGVIKDYSAAFKVKICLSSCIQLHGHSLGVDRYWVGLKLKKKKTAEF